MICVCNSVGFFRPWFQKRRNLKPETKKMNVLLVALCFNSEDDFDISVCNIVSCQSHGFKQVVMLTHKKMGTTASTNVYFGGSILRFLFGTISVVNAMITNKL
jgi:hypothetical protein